MSDFTEARWARAGKKAVARSEAKRRPIRAAVVAASVKGLEGVPFASKRAWELALAAGLAWPNFEGIVEGSANGYTANDVRRIVRFQHGNKEFIAFQKVNG